MGCVAVRLYSVMGWGVTSVAVCPCCPASVVKRLCGGCSGRRLLPSAYIVAVGGGVAALFVFIYILPQALGIFFTYIAFFGRGIL